MNGRGVLRCAVLVVVALGLVALPALADRQIVMNADIAKKAVAAMEEGKTSLAKAVEAAEAHSKGKAMYAHPQFDAKGQFTIEVCCLVGDQLKEVLLDNAGKVTTMRDEPKFDQPEGKDKEKAKEEPKKPETPPKHE
jgi:hypothetical protein